MSNLQMRVLTSKEEEEVYRGKVCPVHGTLKVHVVEWYGDQLYYCPKCKLQDELSLQSQLREYYKDWDK